MGGLDSSESMVSALAAIAVSRPDLGLPFGVLHFGFSLFWITEVSGLGWVALALILALYPAGWCGVWSLLLRDRPQELSSWFNLKVAALGACAWVCFEWVRGWLFTGFPWNFLGVTQSGTVAILQIADLGGVLLVSWLVALINLILALTLLRLFRELRHQQKARPHYDFTVSMLLVALAFGYGAGVIFETNEPRSRLNFLAVQPNLPQDPWGEGVTLDQAVQRMAQLTLTGLGGNLGPEATQKLDLVVWPETPVGRDLGADPVFQEFLHFVTSQAESSFLFGSNVFEGGQVFNSALLHQPGGLEPQVYRKQHLVIMGEYVPMANVLPF
ncbi:MAG: apolipoprotein N-acyltransferase [Blastochloris sp.]|nr:apolipoprotein N-acyltransferase [Blastochloris sp.]